MENIIELTTFKDFTKNYEKEPLHLKTGKQLKESLDLYLEFAEQVSSKEFALIQDIFSHQRVAVTAEKQEHTRLAYSNSRALEVLKRYNLLNQIEKNEMIVNDAIKKLDNIADDRFPTY